MFKDKIVATMKRLYTLFTVLVFLSLSCSKDDYCGENGTWSQFSEQCDCDDYYEGELCETLVREKYLGNWVGYGYKCIKGDVKADGFEVNIVNASPIWQVDLLSSGVLLQDTIPAVIVGRGEVLYDKTVIVDDREAPSYSLRIFHREEPERLDVYLDKNEMAGQSSDYCVFTLRRQ